MNLNGKIALVTGASGDIGQSICKVLAKEGACVIAHYNKNESKIKELIESIKNSSGYALPVKFDVSNRNEVIEALRNLMRQVPKIDILVNNAGISKYNLFIDISEEEWDEMFNVNVKGIFNCTQYILKNSMIPQKYGKIINISSIWGTTGASCESHYSATKSAIIGLTKSLAKEYAYCNINVNAITPGVIDTKMLGCLDQETLEDLKESTPLNRLGTPLDIANCAAFLSSDDSSFITGQVISPNGGILI